MDSEWMKSSETSNSPQGKNKLLQNYPSLAKMISMTLPFKTCKLRKYNQIILLR